MLLLNVTYLLCIHFAYAEVYAPQPSPNRLLVLVQYTTVAELYYLHHLRSCAVPNTGGGGNVYANTPSIATTLPLPKPSRQHHHCLGVLRPSVVLPQVEDTRPHTRKRARRATRSPGSLLPTPESGPSEAKGRALAPALQTGTAVRAREVATPWVEATEVRARGKSGGKGKGGGGGKGGNQQQMSIMPHRLPTAHTLEGTDSTSTRTLLTHAITVAGLLMATIVLVVAAVEEQLGAVAAAVAGTTSEWIYRVDNSRPVQTFSGRTTTGSRYCRRTRC
jgi:hypothetical protein